MFKGLLTGLVILAAATGCTRKNQDAQTQPAADVAGAAASTTGDILIGQYGSMTGGEATFGVSTDEGVRMAIDEKNAAGGVKGRKLKLITYDDQGKPEEAA